MTYRLTQRFYFEAAHTLKRQIEAESSKRIHGHTYIAEVTIAGEPDPQTGMVTDLGQLRRDLERVRATLDHHFLDDIAEIGPATLENLCAYLWRQLLPSYPGLARVQVRRDASGDACELSA